MLRSRVLIAVLVFAGLSGTASAASAPPAWVGSISTGSSTVCSDGTTLATNALSGVTNVAVASAAGHTYAYAVGYWSGQLSVIDITNPVAPAIVGCTPATTSMVAATDIALSGNLAYVTSKNRNACATPPCTASNSTNDDGSGNALTIVDVSNPASPSVVGAVHDSVNLFGAYGDVVVGIGGSTYALVASQGLLGGQPKTPDTSTGSLTVVDVSNPGSPAIAGGGAATISNANLHGAFTNGLNHATSVASYSAGGHTYAYVTAFYGHRLTVFDVTNPATAPVPAASIADTRNLGDPNDIVVSGHYAYVVNQVGTLPQLAIYDLSNPTSPKLAGKLTNSGLKGAYRVRVFGNIAYIAATNANAVGMVDVSNASAPVYLGEVVATQHLNSATSVAIDPTASGMYPVGVQPLAKGQSRPIYPPYPLQSGGPTNTGAVTVIQADPATLSVAITAHPSNPTTASTVSFAFAASDQIAILQCKFDGGALTPCSTGTAQYSNVSVGTHTFTVQATDALGNTAPPASYTFTRT